MRLPSLQSPLTQLTSVVAAVATALGPTSSGFVARASAAEGAPKILVLPFAPLFDQVPPGIGQKTAELLEDELKNLEAVQIVTSRVSEKPAKKAGGPVKDAAALASAEERIQRGKELMKGLKFKPAADELSKAVSGLEGQHAFADFGKLVDAYLGLAVAYVRMGKDSDGEKLLASVIRLDSERELDPEEYPPAFQRIYNGIKKKLLAQPRASFRVEPGGGSASVFIDGKERGKSPVLVKDLVKGTHFLKLVSSSGELWAQKVEGTAGEPVKVSPDLGGASAIGSGPGATVAAMLRQNQMDEGAVSKVAKLAAQAGVDYVVVGGVHRSGESFIASPHLFSAEKRAFCALTRIAFDPEMLGAGIEIYKLSSDVGERVGAFGDKELVPFKVARDAAAPSVESGGIQEVSAATPVSARAPSKVSGGRAPAGARTPLAPASPKVSSGEDLLVIKDEEAPREQPRRQREEPPAREEPRRRRAEPPPEEEPRRRRDEVASDDEPRSKVDLRTLSRKSRLESEPRIADEEPAVPVDEQPKAGMPGWGLALIVAGTVGVLAGGGYGIYRAVSTSSQPPTGSLSITW